MGWNKENRKRLHDLLKGADHDKLQNLGVDIIKAPLGEKENQENILIPINLEQNKSQLIRYQLHKNPKFSIQKIMEKIEEEFWVEVSPNLVSLTTHYIRHHGQGEETGPEVEYLKIPKELAEKIAVLGAP
jgi:hypothetical protein